MNKLENLTYKKLLKTPNYEHYKPKSGEANSGRYKNTKNIFKSNNLQGEGVKVFILSKIIDIYTRLEVLLGLNLSGHTDTLTEASNLKMNYTKEKKFRINDNIEMLFKNFLPNKWNCLVKY